MKAKLLSLTFLSALALIGCDKKEQPKPSEPETVSEAVAPNCDDASVKNSLIKALSTQIGNDVNQAMTNYPNASELDLSRRTLQRLSELTLDLQNVKAEGDSCRADMVITLPVVDATYAERHYANNNLPALANQLSQAGLSFNNGYISAPLSYVVAGSTASLKDGMQGLSAIANIMSASAYSMAQDENHINTAARAPIKVRPLEPTPIARPEPLPAPELAEPQEQQPESQDPLVRQFEASQNTNNEAATPRAEAPQPTKTTKTEYAPVDGEGEITIVETDETY